MWVDDGEVRAIADHLDKPVGEIRLFHTRPIRGRASLNEFANGDCTFFDPETRGCKIYPVRPRQCRTWPFWGSNVATQTVWKKTCLECPGAGQGQLVELDEIQRRVEEIDM